MTALWIHELADRFWEDCDGPPDGFPRDLRDSLVWAFPVSIVLAPGLSVRTMNAYLASRSIPPRFGIPDRPLRAALVVHREAGFLFLDTDDDEAEQRTSVAHEVAHYLIESALPRARAQQRLGGQIVDVLDGERPASERERIGALLGGVELAPRVHLMERTADGHLPGLEVSRAERDADALAFELLAPVDEVRAVAPSPEGVTTLEMVLSRTFGLPLSAARQYAQLLAPAPTGSSLFGRLFGER